MAKEIINALDERHRKRTDDMLTPSEAEDIVLDTSIEEPVTKKAKTSHNFAFKRKGAQT